MTKTEDAVIKYQISFEKYKNGQSNEILALLDNANAEISKYLKKTTGIYTKARYKEIAKKLKEISSALKSSVESGIDIDGVIDYELKKQSKILDTLKNDIQKVNELEEINFLYPSREQIKTAALFNPITTDGYGLTFQSYLDGIENGLYSTWDTAVRTGYLTGIPTKQIVTNVLGGVSKIDKLANAGSITSLRNSVYANTRTVLQSIANETQRRVYEENEKYFGGKDDYKYEYLSTLDSRTCLVCATASEHLYKELKDIPHIPQHRGCRCCIVPYYDIKGDTKASKDGYVDSKITFNDWLKEQDEETQLDVLGRTRFNLFKNGEPITQFVDNGKVLKLSDLEKSLKVTGNKNSDYLANFNKSETTISVEEALKQTNPNFNDSFGFQNNCQRCCPTYEAIRRGYSVTARPIGAKNIDEVNADIFSDFNSNAFAQMYKNPDIRNISVKKSKDIAGKIETIMKEWGDGSRCEIAIIDKNFSGHVFMAEQENGKTIYIDPQSNIKYDRKIFKQITKSSLVDYPVKFFRTDNLDFNDLINLCLKNKENK